MLRATSAVGIELVTFSVIRRLSCSIRMNGSNGRQAMQPRGLFFSVCACEKKKTTVAALLAASAVYSGVCLQPQNIVCLLEKCVCVTVCVCNVGQLFLTVSFKTPHRDHSNTHTLSHRPQQPRVKVRAPPLWATLELQNKPAPLSQTPSISEGPRRRGVRVQ